MGPKKRNTSWSAQQKQILVETVVELAADMDDVEPAMNPVLDTENNEDSIVSSEASQTTADDSGLAVAPVRSRGKVAARGGRGRGRKKGMVEVAPEGSSEVKDSLSSSKELSETQSSPKKVPGRRKGSRNSKVDPSIVETTGPVETGKKTHGRGSGRSRGAGGRGRGCGGRSLARNETEKEIMNENIDETSADVDKSSNDSSDINSVTVNQGNDSDTENNGDKVEWVVTPDSSKGKMVFRCLRKSLSNTEVSPAAGPSLARKSLSNTEISPVAGPSNVRKSLSNVEVSSAPGHSRKKQKVEKVNISMDTSLESSYVNAPECCVMLGEEFEQIKLNTDLDQSNYASASELKTDQSDISNSLETTKNGNINNSKKKSRKSKKNQELDEVKSATEEASDVPVAAAVKPKKARKEASVKKEATKPRGGRVTRSRMAVTESQSSEPSAECDESQTEKISIDMETESECKDDLENSGDTGDAMSKNTDHDKSSVPMDCTYGVADDKNSLVTSNVDTTRDSNVADDNISEEVSVFSSSSIPDSDPIIKDSEISALVNTAESKHIDSVLTTNDNENSLSAANEKACTISAANENEGSVMAANDSAGLQVKERQVSTPEHSTIFNTPPSNPVSGVLKSANRGFMSPIRSPVKPESISLDPSKVGDIPLKKRWAVKSRPWFGASKADIFIGSHISATGDLASIIYLGKRQQLRAVGLFLRPQAEWISVELDDDDVRFFKAAVRESGISVNYIIPHGSYMLNCGSADPERLRLSRNLLVDDLQRCQLLNLHLYNFHPGSYKSGTLDECLKRIAESINYAHARSAGVITLIENTCGGAGIVGGKFEELKKIIDQVTDKSRVGVCLDTCHAFSAGYDIRSESGYDSMMSELDDVIGLKYLMAIHANDSKDECGSCLDHHACIGTGSIGKECFRLLVNDRRLENIPIILETPTRSHVEEIRTLYDLIE